MIVAGVDIGGTNTVYGLVDRNGNIIDRGVIATHGYSSPDVLVKEVCGGILGLLGKNAISESEILGIGIGAPNGNYFTGNVEFAPNMNWFGVVPLVNMFTECSGVKAVLTNDANAAAMGEMIFGAAKGMKDFLFITLGTGLGSGIVVNGEMVYGHDGFAGEIGHVIMDINGRQCGCGRKGCLETYCSAPGIIKTYLELKSSDLGIKQSSTDNQLDGKGIYQRAVSGEAEALEAFRRTGEVLGLALANSVVYTSPQAIFLFGGLAQAGDFLFEPTKASFDRNLLNVYKGKVHILSSGLKENDAALLGAASLVFKQAI